MTDDEYKEREKWLASDANWNRVCLQSWAFFIGVALIFTIPFFL